MDSSKVIYENAVSTKLRIIEKYDEVLYCLAPEMLYKETHLAVKDLLRSADCTAFLEDADISNHRARAWGETLIRKITSSLPNNSHHNKE